MSASLPETPDMTLQKAILVTFLKVPGVEVDFWFAGQKRIWSLDAYQISLAYDW